MFDLLIPHLPAFEALNLAVSLALLGLIWTIQLVHYPSFGYVSHENFVAFERFHSQRISLLVIPLMLTELALAALLLVLSAYSYQYILCALAVLGIWLSTFFSACPAIKS